jgi:agmatinase
MSFDPDAPAATDNLFGLRCTAETSRIHVQAVPWEATTSYGRGTQGGPAALAAASLQVDLLDLEYGDFWKSGIWLAPVDPRFQAWGREAEDDALAVIRSSGGNPDAAARVNRLSGLVNDAVYAAASEVLRQRRIPALIGGDHSTPFGQIRAVAERFPGVGILHVDAHADLREAYEGFAHSHASIMHNVLRYIPDVACIAQVGIRDFGQAELDRIRNEPRVNTWFDVEVGRRLAGGETWLRICEQIVQALPENVYVSFDVDGMEPALCPATGTPVPGGLSWNQVLTLLSTLADERRIVGFDVNEVGPAEWDGNVAARLLYKLCGATLRSQEAAQK